MAGARIIAACASRPFDMRSAVAAAALAQLGSLMT